jgi:hypothetical protein
MKSVDRHFHLVLWERNQEFAIATFFAGRCFAGNVLAVNGNVTKFDLAQTHLHKPEPLTK